MKVQKKRKPTYLPRNCGIYGTIWTKVDGCDAWGILE